MFGDPIEEVRLECAAACLTLSQIKAPGATGKNPQMSRRTVQLLGQKFLP